MDWNLSWMGWTLVGIDLVFSIISIFYAYYLTHDQSLPHNRVDDDATLTARAGDVDEYEIICIKFGRQEAVRVTMAKLIFNHLCPGMLPTPNLKEFIRCYEKRFTPVLGAKPLEEILEWRKKGWQFRFW